MAGDERGHPPGPYCHPTQGALSPSQNNFSETAFETQTPPGGYIKALAPHARGPRAARTPQGRTQLPSHSVADGDTGVTLTVTSPTCYRGRQTPGLAPHQWGQPPTDSDRSSLLLPGTLPSN